MSISHATTQTSITTSTIFGSLLASVQSVQKKAGESLFSELKIELHHLFADAEQACMKKLLAQFDW